MSVMHERRRGLTVVAAAVEATEDAASTATNSPVGRHKEKGSRESSTTVFRSAVTAANPACKTSGKIVSNGSEMKGHVLSQEPPVYDDCNRKIGPIDLSEPLVPQIYRLTKKEYIDLSSEFVCTTKPAIFFSNSLLEAFSRTKWWVIPSIWLPVALVNALTAKRSYDLSFSFMASSFVVGLFVWTLAEYMIHRFLFHFSESVLPDSRVARLGHFLMHSVHHLLPMDPLRLVMPPILLISLMTPFYIIFSLFIPQPLLRAMWTGLLVGYVCYDMIHYAEHHFPTDKMPYLRYMKAYHMKHHFKHPLLAFGVSNPFWDYIFGTAL